MDVVNNNDNQITFDNIDQPGNDPLPISSESSIPFFKGIVSWQIVLIILNLIIVFYSSYKQGSYLGEGVNPHRSGYIFAYIVGGFQFFITFVLSIIKTNLDKKAGLFKSRFIKSLEVSEVIICIGLFVLLVIPKEGEVLFLYLLFVEFLLSLGFIIFLVSLIGGSLERNESIEFKIFVKRLFQWILILGVNLFLINYIANIAEHRGEDTWRVPQMEKQAQEEVLSKQALDKAYILYKQGSVEESKSQCRLATGLANASDEYEKKWDFCMRLISNSPDLKDYL